MEWVEVETRKKRSRSPLARLYVGKAYRNEGLPDILECILPTDRHILDVGCGAGGNAKLLSGGGRELIGITVSRKEALIAAPFFKRVIVGDIEHIDLAFPVGYFDVLLFSHVLEHLVDPWSTLKRFARFLSRKGRCLIALPNHAYYKNRFQLLRGNFCYQDGGLMDRTHLRFFTYETAKDLVRSAGLRIVSSRVIGAAPLWPLRRLVGTNTVVDRLSGRILPNFFGYSIIITAEKPSQISSKRYAMKKEANL